MGSTVIGYKYKVGMHIVYAHGPIDELQEIKVDDKLAWSGSSTGGRISISKSKLFGGQTGQGGLSGEVDVEFGRSTQGVNDYLQSTLPNAGGGIPAFRGVFGLVLRRFYIGNSTYMKNWELKCKRILSRTDGSAQWYSAKAAIGSDMNPAHIIHELLTNKEWGLGYNSGDLDDPSFTASADTLYTESLGISLVWDTGTSIEDFLGTVLQHIDGSLYVDQFTGKFKLKLIREDYVVANLLVLDESNVKSVANYGKTAVGELVNSLTLVYDDITTGEDNTVSVQNLALINVQGKVVSKKVNYPGLSNAAAANLVANRELAKLSRPLLRCKVTANRDAADLNVGDVFVLSWPRLGLASTVMRVSAVNIGTLDKPEVKIDCVEDIFKSVSTIFSAPNGSEWVTPVTAPANPTYRLMFEAPYYDIANTIGDSAAKAIQATSGFAAITAVRPSGDSINASLFSLQNGAYAEYGVANFCPTAQIAGDITKTTTTIGLINGVDLDLVEVGTGALIDNEIVVVTAISETSITFGRGASDTVPATHASGARIYFYEGFTGSDGVEYTLNETATYKLLTNTGSGQLDISSATPNSIAIARRQAKPYPPGLFQVQAQNWPSVVAGETITVAWAHRDRLLLTGGLVATTYGNVGPEPGTTYTVEYRSSTDTLIKSVTGVTANFYTLTAADLGTTHFDGVKVNVWAVRDSIASHQTQTHQFDRTGYGLDYGNYYGGV